MEKGGSVGTRAFESCVVTLIGILCSLGWFYAEKRRRLLSAEVTDTDVNEHTNRVLTDLITPIITIPFAFVGPVYWEISWLSYFFISFLVKRLNKAKTS